VDEVGPHPGGPHSPPPRDEPHQVLSQAGEGETEAGGPDGNRQEDAQGHLLDA